jgi:hypothetical protein
MALNSFQLFISQIQSAPEVLKVRVLQIVFDILMVHEGDFLGKAAPQVSLFSFRCASNMTLSLCPV